MTEAGKRLLDWFGGPMRPGEARNLGKAILDIEAEARRDLEQRLAEARDFLVLKEWGHVGPDHIPWFTHGAISHAADAACVICRWLAPHDATATPE